MLQKGEKKQKPFATVKTETSGMFLLSEAETVSMQLFSQRHHLGELAERQEGEVSLVDESGMEGVSGSGPGGGDI